MRTSVIASVLFLLCFGTANALTIFSDNFDSSATTLAGWKRSSTTYVTMYTGTYKVGTAAMQLQYTYTAITYLNVSAFKNMVLKYKLAAYSLETGENIKCQYSTNGGSTWITAATLSDPSDTGAYTSYTTSIPLCTTLQIKFVMTASDTYDYGYVDDIVLTGDRK